MYRRQPDYDGRTLAQVREQYEIEKKLASRLRNSSWQEREHLYSSLYDELYRLVPHHPQLVRKLSPEAQKQAVCQQMKLLSRYLRSYLVFLEIGPGDCALSFAVAKIVGQVYAVDVSAEITKSASCPENFTLLLSDGRSVALPEGSVDVAYSYELMEHLHPEDALQQLRNVHRVLVPGGAYVCCTPNRLRGPHDVSKYFDRVASGFHLKEYCVRELAALFRAGGFSSLVLYCSAKRRYVPMPIPIVKWCERALCTLPFALRRAIANRSPFRQLLGIQIVGIKAFEPASREA